MSKTDRSNDNTLLSLDGEYTGEPDLFCRVITALQQADHRLCILHGYQHYPEQICSTSDIDAISIEPAQIPAILHQQGIAKVVQVLQHEATAFSYTLYRDYDGTPALILLDVSIDYRRNGRVFFAGQEFFQTCRTFKFFQIPAPELEFAYYTVKKVAKGDLNAAHAQRLSELYREAPDLCQEQLTRFFPEAEASQIANAAHSETWEPVQKQIMSIRQAMLNQVGRNNALNVLRYWISELKRWIRRILNPTGLMIVVLGADGSGKSTVIAQIEDHLKPAFRRTQYIHLRPRLGISEDPNSSPVTDPHGQPPRGWLISIIKLIYFLFDYGVGYIVKVYPQLVRSTFVIFDRYYHDLLVDPKRYRYGGPRWFANALGHWMPKPDLWILLDAPAEVLQSRKQEVSFDETARQREAYLALIQRLPNSHVINTALPLDQVVKESEQKILEFMNNRTNKRLQKTKFIEYT